MTILREWLTDRKEKKLSKSEAELGRLIHRQKAIDRYITILRKRNDYLKKPEMEMQRIEAAQKIEELTRLLRKSQLVKQPKPIAQTRKAPKRILADATD